jgi:copper chaperone CopZ
MRSGEHSGFNEGIEGWERNSCGFPRRSGVHPIHVFNILAAKQRSNRELPVHVSVVAPTTFLCELFTGGIMDETNTEVATGGLHTTEAKGELLETKTLGVAGMTTERCVKKIEKAFKKQPGVKSIHIDRETETATVTFDSRRTNMPELHELLLRSGYKPMATVLAGEE